MMIYVEYRGYCVELPPGDTVIGRDIGCTLRFNDASVSRRHVKLVRERDNVYVEDLGSTNGTYLNGEPVGKRTPLYDRDAIEIGGHQLLLRITSDADESRDTLRVTNFRELGKVHRSPTKPMVRPPRATVPDRRRSERSMVELKLIYVRGTTEVEVTTRDLSTAGVFVCTDKLDAPGTPCELAVAGDPTMRFKGIVRRVVEQPRGREPVGVAIEFIDLDVAEREWLELAINRLSRTTTMRRVERPQ